MASTEQIAKSLRELEHCPSGSLTGTMMLKGLPHAFGHAFGHPQLPKSSLHAYQLEFVKLLRACLEEEKAFQLQAQQKCATEETETQAQVEQDKANLATATVEVGTAEAAVEEKAAALSQKQEATKDEEARYAQAKEDKDAAVLEHQKLEELKAEADSVVNGSLQMLINGGWEDDEACADFVSGVLEYLKTMNCEVPLLVALPKALSLRPSDRGEFDDITLKEVVRVMEMKVTSLAADVEKDNAKMEEFNAIDLGAWAVLDIARDAEKAAVKAHADAEEALEAKTSERSALDAKVADSTTLLQKALASKAIADSKVEEIQLSLAELERLETMEEQEDKENVDIPEPSPKKRKMDAIQPDVQVQPPLVAAQ